MDERIDNSWVDLMGDCEANRWSLSAGFMADSSSYRVIPSCFLNFSCFSFCEAFPGGPHIFLKKIKMFTWK